ncbi:MAG: DUF2267 domain-containing protein [Hyphomicrobiales bacterium]
MDELIAKLTQTAGIDAATAQSAVAIILNFLKREAPAEHVEQAVAAIPGAQQAADQQVRAASGGAGGVMAGLGGLMGGAGGLMALAGQLTGAGLSMGQMQVVGKELFAHVREKAGEDVVGGIVAAVPGLAQFV